jgi:hypothetical protein
MRLGSTLTVWLVLCACGELDQDSGARLGEQGRVEFSYRRNCFFGCPLEQPLLAGTRQTIDVSGVGDGEGVDVQSSDTEVIEVHLERRCYCERTDRDVRIDVARDASCEGPWRKRCDNDVLLQAVEGGDAFVELFGADAELLDRARVQVRPAERASFFAILAAQLGRREGSEFTLAIGEKLTLEVELYDDQGRALIAPEGVSWSSDAEQVAVVSAWLVGRGAELEAGLSVEVEAVATGEAAIELDVPGLTDAVRVIVE